MIRRIAAFAVNSAAAAAGITLTVLTLSLLASIIAWDWRWAWADPIGRAVVVVAAVWWLREVVRDPPFSKEDF